MNQKSRLKIKQNNKLQQRKIYSVGDIVGFICIYIYIYIYIWCV